jgi:hypothetical protein
MVAAQTCTGKGPGFRPSIVPPMSASGQKPTCAPQNVMSALPPIADMKAQAGVRHRPIIRCSDRAQISNKIIQKGLAFRCIWSGSGSSLGCHAHSEILPRRLRSRGGASVVGGRPPQTERRISMSQSVKKQTTASPTAPASNNKLTRQPASNPKSKKSDRVSKQSHVIAMLQSPKGATIAALAGSDTRCAVSWPGSCANV